VYAKTCKLACTPFAAVGGNKEGAKSATCLAVLLRQHVTQAFKKKKKKKGVKKESEILFPLHINLVFRRIFAHVVLDRDDIGYNHVILSQ
jgi:hypothetical protein